MAWTNQSTIRALAPLPSFVWLLRPLSLQSGRNASDTADAGKPPLGLTQQTHSDDATPSQGGDDTSSSPVGDDTPSSPGLYKLVAADLRDTAGLEKGLRGAGVDFSAPTIFLAECVLVYMEPAASASLLKVP